MSAFNVCGCLLPLLVVLSQTPPPPPPARRGPKHSLFRHMQFSSCMCVYEQHQHQCHSVRSPWWLPGQSDAPSCLSPLGKACPCCGDCFGSALRWPMSSICAALAHELNQPYMEKAPLGPARTSNVLCRSTGSKYCSKGPIGRNRGRLPARSTAPRGTHMQWKLLWPPLSCPSHVASPVKAWKRKFGQAFMERSKFAQQPFASECASTSANTLRRIRLDFVGSKLHDDPELRTLEAATTHSANLLVAEARAHKIHWRLCAAVYIDAHDLLLRPRLGWMTLQYDYKEPLN